MRNSHWKYEKQILNGEQQRECFAQRIELILGYHSWLGYIIPNQQHDYQNQSKQVNQMPRDYQVL